MIPHRKRVQALLTKRGRKEQQRFLVEGVRLVEEALAANLAVEWLYHLPALPETRLAAVLEMARGRGVHLAEVTPDELLSLSDTETPQGVVGVAEIPRWSEEDLRSRTGGDVLVLDMVRDPGNLGTLLRTAEAAGARSVLMTHGCVEATNPKVVRSAMGAFFRIPCRTIRSPDEVAERCRGAGLPLVLTTAHGGEPASHLLRYGSVALVLGGEAEGVGPVWEPYADAVVRLPMSATTESLNVAVAGGIFLFRHIWQPDAGPSGALHTERDSAASGTISPPPRE